MPLNSKTWAIREWQYHEISRLERQVRELQVQLATLRSLLEETRSMHLRTEEHRDWLERRDSALAMPKEQGKA